MKINFKKIFRLKFVIALCLAAVLIGGFLLTSYFVGSSIPASGEEKDAVDSAEGYETYLNPLKIEGAWSYGGIADPFIMRFNGMYYMYATTDWQQVGHKIWSSENLIDWKYEGLSIDETDPDLHSMWGQEVFYYNGKFYSTFSLAGRDNLLYRSNSPLGPFQKVSDVSLGDNDVSIFVDDDGRWYLYMATGSGIQGVELQPGTPNRIGSPCLIGVEMGHWVEGPYLFKEDGTYFMLYTGNHWLSAGYRMDYAVSHDSPLEGFEMADNNPLLINTDDANFNGLGHGHAVRGPDLDSVFTVYHNLVAPTNVTTRRMPNINQLAIDGDKLSVLGPTNYEFAAPKMPEVYADIADAAAFEGRKIGNDVVVLTKLQSGDEYSAEFNLSAGGGKTGAVFGYASERDFYSVDLRPDSSALQLCRHADGNTTKLSEIPMFDGYSANALTEVRIEVFSGKLEVYVNSKLRYAQDGFEGKPGKIGYIAGNASLFESVGKTVLSGSVNGSSCYDALKPVESVIPAAHFMEGENRGYFTTAEPVENAVREKDKMQTVSGDRKNHAVRLSRAGDWVKYRVYSPEEALYQLTMTASRGSSGAKLRVFSDNAPISECRLEPKYLQNEWTNTSVAQLKLKKGIHTVKLQLLNSGFLWGVFGSNELVFSSLKFEKIISGVAYTNSFESGGDLKIYGDADMKWRVRENELRCAGEGDLSMAVFDAYGRDAEKKLTGNLADFEAEFDVSYDTFSQAGILFRSVNHSYYGEQTTASFSGYFLKLDGEYVTLDKVNYRSEEIASSGGFEYPEGGYQHFKIVVKKNTIKVFIDGKSVFDLCDDTFTSGKIGFITYGGKIGVKNVSIKSL